MTSSYATPSADPILPRIARVLGWLCVFATLALLSPGVVATASADEPAAAGPSCPVSREGDEHSVADLERMVERMRAEVAEQPGAPGDVVSLNTRGFNYASPAVPVEPDAGSR